MAEAIMAGEIASDLIGSNWERLRQSKIDAARQMLAMALRQGIDVSGITLFDYRRIGFSDTPRNATERPAELPDQTYFRLGETSSN